MHVLTNPFPTHDTVASMTLLQLKYRYGQKISFALLAMMLLTLLQLCVMNNAQAEMKHEPGKMMMDMSDKGMSESMEMDHDCCEADNPASRMELESELCPECDSDDNALNPLLPDYKPLFTLLYVVTTQLLVDVQSERNWLDVAQLSIQTSLPEIYLANASFLE